MDYIAMYHKDRKYIYYEDKFGITIGYIDILQPFNEDFVFITIIADKDESKEQEWNITNRGTQISVDLRKAKKWKFYEDYEEFCADFFEAIL